MKHRLHNLFSLTSAALFLASPLLAEEPTDTGKPESAVSSPAEDASSYLSIESQIKIDQQNLQAEATNDIAKMDASLLKEVQKRDGFSAQSKQALDKYLKANGGSWKNVAPLPPGLQKKAERGEALPPGWQKKLGMGEIVPNDIFDHARKLPKDVYESYPHPEGTEDVLIEDQLYRITKKTHEIIDIFSSMPATAEEH